METSSTEPLVVVQPSLLGPGIVVGLAYETDPLGEGVTNLVSDGAVRPAGDFPPIERDLNEEAVPQASTSRASAVWADLRTRLVRRSRGSTIQPRLQFCPPSTSIERLVHFLSVDETPKAQEQAAKQMAEVSSVDEYRSCIANSSTALASLTRLLFLDNPCSCYAAVTLGNLAGDEDYLECFQRFPGILTGLVRLLFRCEDGFAQREAAVALANLSLWPEGGNAILETPQAIKGLVELATVTQTVSCGSNGSKEEAKRTLVNLAVSRKNSSLATLTRCLTMEDDRIDSSRSLVMQEKAMRTLANLSNNKARVEKIVECNEFPLFLAVLVRFLANSGRPTTGLSDSLAVRKMATIALANLSITEAVQLMVAEFPNALTGLFMCIRFQDGASAISLQLQECAAMALGNLALAKDNRRKIVEFGGADGLAAMASMLFQDDNPGGQEYVAWALANLSHDPHDSGDAAVKIAASPNIVRGLARLLQLPTRPSESGVRSRVEAQEQAVRALANLTYPHASQVKIARVPNVVKALAAAVLSRRCQGNLSVMTQELAARALANLTCAKKNWRSSELFEDAIRALVDVVSTGNVEATQKTRKYGAIALGNFALAPDHHRAIVDSKEAMTGLVSMLFGWDTLSEGKEQAAWTLANLAQGAWSVKAAIASVPFAVSGLIGLLSDLESPHVQDQARRALVALQNYGRDGCVSRVSAGGAASNAGSSNDRLFSRFDIMPRLESCI